VASVGWDICRLVYLHKFNKFNEFGGPHSKFSELSSLDCNSFAAAFTIIAALEVWHFAFMFFLIVVFCHAFSSSRQHRNLCFRCTKCNNGKRLGRYKTRNGMEWNGTKVEIM